MSNNLHYVIVSLCTLCLGAAAAEDCFNAVLNKRATFEAAAGQSLSLSCVVQHCGHSFSGKWVWKNSNDTFSAVQTTQHHRLRREDLSTNQTRLTLDLLSVSESDGGSYGCRVEWSSLEVEQGHFMVVNVTEAVTSDPTRLHWILVCVAVVLFVSLVLGLVFCLRSKVTPQVLHRKLTPVTSPSPEPRPSAQYQAPRQQSTPQPPPRRHTPHKHKTASKNAPHQPQQKTEVVYADISQDALLRQQERVKESQQSTVYSSVRFT